MCDATIHNDNDRNNNIMFFGECFDAMNYYDRSIFNPSVNTCGVILDQEKIISIHVRDKLFLVDSHTLSKSKILQKNNTNNKISIDEDPILFKHIIKYMKYHDYVYPYNLKSELCDLQSKYEISKYSFVGSHYANPNLTPKAKMYIDNAKGDINLAFSKAICEDSQTLKSIYNQGVDINFDVENANKSNMFYRCITAHGVCDPYFLELMFRFEREDIDVDGQKVFDMACAYGDNRHIDIFMKRHHIYKWNVFSGMKQATNGGNLANLHHLIMFHALNDEELKILFELSSSRDKKIITYLCCNYVIVISKEILLGIIINSFYDDLSVIIPFYFAQKNNDPFEIDSENVKLILSGTSDRMEKLELLNQLGFKIDNYSEIKEMANKDPNSLPKTSKRRFYSMSH